MTEKVRPGRIDDSLPARITPSSQARFVCPFHIRDSFSTTRKLIQFIQFPKDSDRPRHHEHFAAGKMLGMRKNDMVLVGLASLTNYAPNEFGINA